MRASFLCLVKALIALDFPAFDRPANATSMPSSGGQDFKVGAPSRNFALCKREAIEDIVITGFLGM